MPSLAQLMRRLRYGRPIVVVSGLPRSGTSMMMQMLQAGGLELVTDDIRTPDGSNPKGYFELEAVKDLDKGPPPAWLAGAPGKAVKVVSSLVRWLPETRNYQVIFMQREPRRGGRVPEQDADGPRRAAGRSGRTSTDQAPVPGAHRGDAPAAAGDVRLDVSWSITVRPLARPEETARPSIDSWAAGWTSTGWPRLPTRRCTGIAATCDESQAARVTPALMMAAPGVSPTWIVAALVAVGCLVAVFVYRDRASTPRSVPGRRPFRAASARRCMRQSKGRASTAPTSW